MGFGVGTGLSIGASLLDSYGKRKEGKEARKRGREQRIYNEVAATQVVARGQHTAMEEIRQARLVASRAIAVAAAGGYSEDIDHLLADIEGEGIYAASLATWEAETEAERMRFSGEQARKQGEDIYKSAKRSAFGSILGGFGTFVDSMPNKGPIKSRPGKDRESGWKRSPF
jgi:hypothetical protein